MHVTGINAVCFASAERRRCFANVRREPDPFRASFWPFLWAHPAGKHKRTEMRCPRASQRGVTETELPSKSHSFRGAAMSSDRLKWLPREVSLQLPQNNNGRGRGPRPWLGVLAFRQRMQPQPAASIGIVAASGYRTDEPKHGRPSCRAGRSMAACGLGRRASRASRLATTRAVF